MRTIKFRGKSVESGLWYYGYYICHDFMNSHFIIEDDINIRVQVDPDTVGQFTGQVDKNGQEIYENDIVEILSGPRILYTVVWSDSLFTWVLKPKQDPRIVVICTVTSSGYLIIGNLTDNPELLEGK